MTTSLAIKNETLQLLTETVIWLQLQKISRPRYCLWHDPQNVNHCSCRCFRNPCTHAVGVFRSCSLSPRHLETKITKFVISLKVARKTSLRWEEKSCTKWYRADKNHGRKDEDDERCPADDCNQPSHYMLSNKSCNCSHSHKVQSCTNINMRP